MSSGAETSTGNQHTSDEVPVPTQEHLFGPILRAVADGRPRTLEEVRDAVAQLVGLDEARTSTAHCANRLPSSSRVGSGLFDFRDPTNERLFLNPSTGQPEPRSTARVAPLKHRAPAIRSHSR